MYRMIAIGLISGTSLDGIDAAIIDIPDEGHNSSDMIRMLGFATYPYPDGLRERLLDISMPGNGSVEQICHLNAYVGELFALAAQQIAEETGIALEQVDVIGSHGQTIHHLPQSVYEGMLAVTSTLQIGEPSVIAERTGVTTVADFRPRDMAAGGQGAPFAPYAHYVLFRHPKRNRIITNIGGISNVTFLPAAASPEGVVAFDTGPGNMIVDALMSQLSENKHTYDPEGQWARQGKCSQELLEWMLKHPYFQRKPPKSTGREEFGDIFVRQIDEQAHALRLTPLDCVATATALTARTIADSCRRWLAHQQDPEDVEMFCGGGGVKNQTLMTILQQECAPISVSTVDQLGISGDALEAMTFALLARATLLGNPFYLPNVTGAKHPVLLGKIIPGRRKMAWKTLENI